MRILTLTNSPLDPQLGSGKTVLNFSQGLREQGHQVETYGPQDFRLGAWLSRPKQLLQAIGAHRLVRRKMRRARYDILECYGGEFGLTTWFYSRRRRRPLLVAHTNGLELLDTERGQDYDAQRVQSRSILDKLYHRIAWLSFERADAFVCLCETDLRWVLENKFYAPNRAIVVEPGLDEPYLSVPFDAPREERVAFTGSWIARKGTALLCRIMTRLMERRPALMLDIYGAAGARETILSAFPELLRERVSVHPRLSETEIAAGLSRAKVFFFPTQYEGFGIALAEAMACGCACVTTPTGYGAELRDGAEAILCGFNDENAMERSVESLLSDESLRLRIAEGAWKRTRTLTWNANVQNLEAAYTAWTAQTARERP